MKLIKVRSPHWIPTLRTVAKPVIKNCRGCKKYGVTFYSEPKLGPLTKDRTEQYFPFQVISVDYAGHISYRLKTKKDLKA